MVAVISDFPRPVAPDVCQLRRAALYSPRAVPARRHSPDVYHRRRLVVVGLALVLAAVSFALIHGALNRDADGGPLTAIGTAGAIPAGEHLWVVEPGDTLWSIALKVAPGRDPRPLVDRLSAEVHGSPLYPGERIAVP